MNRTTFHVIACLAALALPASALAGGFGIAEFGSRQSGRAGAVVALAEDPSVIFFNPANVSRLEGLQVTLGAAGLMPRFSYEGDTSTTSEVAVVPPPHIMATYNLGDVGGGPLGVGLGFYVPYGSSFSWPEDWSGRQAIQKIGLSVFEVSPVLSWQPHRMVSVGVGFRYLPASVYMKQAVGFGSTAEGAVELGGSGSGMGAHAGLSITPNERLSFGLSWRSAVTLKMDGQSNFQFEAPFDTEAHDVDVHTEVPLAQVLRVGVAYDLLPKKLNLSADVEFQMWSAFKELAITFKNPEGDETKASPRKSMDSFVIHVGGEYRFSEAFALRLGYLFDQHTIPDDMVNPAPPDSDKHLIALGASYAFNRSFALHAHFQNVFFAERKVTTNEMPGTWGGGWAGGTMAYIFGLTASGSFDVGPVFGAPAVTPTTM